MGESEQMESNHRHAAYKAAALPLSYVPVFIGCQVVTPGNHEGGKNMKCFW